jgi:hypothetical protein
VRDENPFRDWLTRDVYGGYWVPVGQLGGFLGPAACPAHVRGAKETVLASTEWPLQFNAAEPSVWQSWQNGEPRREAHLYPVEEEDGVSYSPFVAIFDPYGSPSWLEPIQPFILYWRAWPRRDDGGNVSWYEEGDDSRPEEIARWRLLNFADVSTVGLLEVRRDRLMTFMSEFDYDLAVYYEENIEANQLDDGWTDEERDDNRYWRVWATGVHPEIRAVLRAVTYLERPEREEAEEPLAPEARERIPFVVGADARGEPQTATHPPTEFLTPVFFRAEVLERYYQDPSTYRVENDIVRGGRQWALSIARTDRNTVQAWLGDLNGLPVSVQRHWAEYAVPDQGVPNWRLQRDFLAEFVDADEQGPIPELRRVVGAANAAAEERFGEPLYAAVEEVHVPAVRTMRVPANSSFAAFNDQVRTLALLVVDHLSSRFLDAAEAPPDNNGPLNRLARLVGALNGEEFEQAKDRIGGLYAIQSVRSNVASHRTGPRIEETLARSGISRYDLPAGYIRLVEGAAASIAYLRDLLLTERN